MELDTAAKSVEINHRFLQSDGEHEQSYRLEQPMIVLIIVFVIILTISTCYLCFTFAKKYRSQSPNDLKK